MYNIYIRPLEKKDALISYKWRNDSEVWKYTGSKPDKEITWEVEDEWIDKVIKDNSNKRFAIIVDDVYIGNIQLTNIKGDSAVYHIFIGDRDYWGKGISKQATFLILNYAKRNLNLSNVILEVKKDNIAAFKSYLKSGFKLIGEKEDWYQMNYNCNEILPITVSVFVMVYNHENFLKQCLDGILYQRTNFNIEIVVGEDCSTDSSREILLEYQLKYPGKFNLILHKENVGANKNQEIVLNNCIGKYIAMCEGDDYWTDPLKLQKQVDFLEENEEYTICFHDVQVLENGVLKNDKNIDGRYLSIINKSDINYKDLLIHGNFIQTCSVLFRNLENYNDLDLIMKFSSVGDYVLHIHNAKFGKIKKLDFYGAVYRRGVGIYSTLAHEDFLYGRLRYLISILKMIDLEEDLDVIHNHIHNQLEEIRKYKLKESDKNYRNLTLKDHLIGIIKKIIK